jgi:mannosyltransferase OCH1-like enzyme
MNVWTYWEGDRPEYISVCLESLKRTCANDNFVIVTPETADGLAPDACLSPRYKLLPSPALRADCIRVALLALYGGWWFDADTVGVRSPSELVANDPEGMYTSWTNAPLRVLNGYIYFREGSDIAWSWLKRINGILNTNLKGVEWCSLGEQIVTSLMTESKSTVKFDRSRVLPIEIDCSVREFFSDKDFESYLNSNTVCFGLNHSWFMYYHGQDMVLPRSKWGSSPLLIHKLLHWAECENERVGNA